jgi:hypothetical protein
MIWVVVLPVALYSAYLILRLGGVFETSAGAKQHNTSVEEENDLRKKRRTEEFKLDTYAEVTRLFKGYVFSERVKENHQYYIDRLGIRSEILNRNLTPEELRGKATLFLVLGILCIPAVFFKVIFIVPVVCAIGYFFIYDKRYKDKIEQEDKLIDDYFINLFLLLNSKLKQGSRGRLSKVVGSYIDSLKTCTDVEVKNTMLKLAEFLLNNLSMYPDHEAVMMLQERYKSATIINFCNVASQALIGVDNADTLLTTKLELLERNKVIMRFKAKALREKGERAVYLIYVILFIFVGAGWYSKVMYLM